MGVLNFLDKIPMIKLYEITIRPRREDLDFLKILPRPRREAASTMRITVNKKLE